MVPKIKSTESRNLEAGGPPSDIPKEPLLQEDIIVSPYDAYDKRVKILIVDDSSYNLFVMGELMQQIKFPPEENKTFHVETALNGQIAVDKVKD